MIMSNRCSVSWQLISGGVENSEGAADLVVVRGGDWEGGKMADTKMTSLTAWSHSGKMGSHLFIRMLGLSHHLVFCTCLTLLRRVSLLN